LIPKGLISFRGRYILESAWVAKVAPSKFRGMPEDSAAIEEIERLRDLFPPMPAGHELIEMARQRELQFRR
jgi:hypothetical protein